MAGRIKTVVGLLSELLDNPKMEQTGRLRDYSNATSKDPDKILEDWMRPNQVVVDPIEYPVVNLSDFEGRGYVLGESDRAIANRRLEGIGNKALSSPIDLNTGSNFMFHNDQVWSSGKSVVSRMMNQAKVLKEQTGKNPIMLPRLLGPQGVDFDKHLMTTMLRWNVVNAPKSTLKQQDVILKDAIPGWRGATDSQSMEAFYNLPADTRKAVQLKLDKLKNEGGLSIGNARVALTNPDLIDVPNNTLPAIAEIDVDKGMAPNSSLNYPFGMYGEGKGILSEPLTARQLTSPDDIFFKNDGTRLPDRYVDYWIKQANPSGILDRAKLNALSDAGVKFKSAAIPGIATALVGASSLYSSDSDAGVVSGTLNAARKIGDDYTSLLDSAAAKQPMDSAILPGQGGQTFVKPDQEATARMYDEFRNQINSVGENVFDSSPISGAIEIGGREGVKGISRYTFPREYAGETSKIGVDSPDIIEFASDETGARLFREKLMEGKDASKYGSSVTAYDVDEYKGMRLFLSEDGSTGYALKPDGDIVSAFSAGKYEGVGPHLIMHGIEQGGKKLDAFDTVLPDLYAQMGFKEAARVKFDPAEAPDDWNMLTYRKFNEGQPDISLMSLDDAPATPVSPNMVDDYGTALDLQSKALASPSGLLRNVFPAPQRMFDPNSKDFKPFLSEFEQQPGGRYLEMGENGPVDITGQYPASANISVGPDGKPKFQVAGEQRSGTPPNEGRKIKTNLFKKKAGWKWSQVPEGYDPEPAGNFPIVSVQDGKNHYYTVDAQFPDGVDLARYEKSASEPRLRPTRKGSVELGEQIGEIDVRGKKHPVYGSAVIRQAAPVATAGLLGAGVLGSEDADAAPLTAFTDKGNKWLQKLLAEAEQADLPQSAIDQGYSPSILQHVGEPGLQGYDLNAAAAANENAVSGMYNYPTKRESDRYLDQMQRYRDKSLEQYETVTRGDKAFVIGGDTPTPEMEQQFLSELEDAFKVKYSELPEHKQGWFDEKVDQFLRYGDLTASPLSRDAKNRIYRAGGADVLVRNGREIVSLKPEQVRSPKAQFNIDDQGSNNFMASVAGAGVLGALALPQNSQAEEYTEAPVIDEQSFGSMIQEYGDINRRAKAADDQKFGLLMAEQDRLATMPGGSWGKASPELSEYRRSQLLPTVAEIGMGGADAVVSGLDFLSNIPGAAATMNWQGATPIRDRLGGLLDYTFVDERDQRARDSARLLGGLLSPI